MLMHLACASNAYGSYCGSCRDVTAKHAISYCCVNNAKTPEIKWAPERAMVTLVVPIIPYKFKIIHTTPFFCCEFLPARTACTCCRRQVRKALGALHQPPTPVRQQQQRRWRRHIHQSCFSISTSAHSMSSTCTPAASFDTRSAETRSDAAWRGHMCLASQ